MIYKFLGVSLICIYILCLAVSLVFMALDAIDKKFEGSDENDAL